LQDVARSWPTRPWPRKRSRIRCICEWWFRLQRTTRRTRLSNSDRPTHRLVHRPTR
jgi:hypothetical protein